VVERRRHARDRGIADKNIEASVPLVERGGEPVEALVVAHVERHQGRRAAGGPHRIVEFFEAADRACHRDHMGAGAGERDPRRVTDAARGAGDERDAAGERFRHAQPASASSDS